MHHLPEKHKQQGIVTLVVTLAILVALSILSVVGVRVALMKQRTATNNAEAATAAAVASGGLQAAAAYLVANKSKMASKSNDGWLNPDIEPHWTACSNSDVEPPCGDGTKNVYDDSWRYFGPLANKTNAAGKAV